MEGATTTFSKLPLYDVVYCICAMWEAHKELGGRGNGKLLQNQAVIKSFVVELI